MHIYMYMYMYMYVSMYMYMCVSLVNDLIDWLMLGATPNIVEEGKSGLDLFCTRCLTTIPHQPHSFFNDKNVNLAGENEIESVVKLL